MNAKNVAVVFVLIASSLAFVPAQAEPGRGNAQSVVTGSTHSCFLLSGGAVDCEGLGYSGETAAYFGGDATAVAVGDSHTCVLKANHNVDCYGSNYAWGQAADYTAGDAVQITAGANHNCVLTSTGNVACYGDNQYHQADNYGGGDATGVWAGFGATCILKSSRNVACQGANGLAPYSGGDAVSVAVGANYRCILKADGDVDCAGGNLYGEANDYLGGDAIAVAAGQYHTCILKSNHNVDCQGHNSAGEATDYTGGDAVAVSAASEQTCILRSNGFVHCNHYDYSAPNPPGGLQAAASHNQVTLTWTAPTAPNGVSGNTVTDYKVYRGSTSGSEVYLTTLGNVLTWTDSGLPDGATRYYVVTAVSIAGESLTSNEAVAKAFDVPSAPQGLAATGSAVVSLSWKAPASNGGTPVTEYDVFVRSASSNERFLARTTSLSYVDSSCPAAQTCYYQVRARNLVGQGPASNEANSLDAPSPSGDLDGDGAAMSDEVDAGSNPGNAASTPASDDDGDGTPNGGEAPIRAYCTGTYGIVLQTCGGYEAPAGVQGNAGRDVEGRAWVWDAVCIPGPYDVCKASSHYQLESADYTGTWTTDGYGWRHVPTPSGGTVTSVPAVTNCGIDDSDNDTLPTLHLCSTTVAVYADGSVQQGPPEPWMAVGDDDQTSLPAGVPTGPSIPMPPGDTKGYIVIPWGQAPLVRAVPAPDASGTIAVLFFLTNLPDGTSGDARLRAFDPLNSLLYDQANEVYFDGDDTSAGLAYFEAIPTQGAAKLQFSYGDVQQDVNVDPGVPEVESPCGTASECVQKCKDSGLCDGAPQPCDLNVPGTCQNPPPDPCAVLRSIPGVCGSVGPQPCGILGNLPPCSPPPQVCRDGLDACVCSLVPCDGDGCVGDLDCLCGGTLMECICGNDSTTETTTQNSCVPSVCSLSIFRDCQLGCQGESVQNPASDCVPTPAVCGDRGLAYKLCGDVTQADACAVPSCYEIPLPMTTTAAAQDENGCRVAINPQGQAWLPARYEQNVTDSQGHPLDVIDYATVGWARQAGYRHTCQAGQQGGGFYSFIAQWSGPRKIRPQLQDTFYSGFMYHGAELLCDNEVKRTDFAVCEGQSYFHLWARPETWAVVAQNDAQFEFTDKAEVWVNGQEKGATYCHPFVEAGVEASKVIDVAMNFVTFPAGWVYNLMEGGQAGAQTYALEPWLEREACRFDRWREMRASANGEDIQNGIAIAQRSYDGGISINDQREVASMLRVYAGGCAKEIELNTMSRVEWSADARALGMADSMGIQWDGDSTWQKVEMDCAAPVAG